MSQQKQSPKPLPAVSKDPALPQEKGGFENRPEPTRYGDWDVNGRCSDF